MTTMELDESEIKMLQMHKVPEFLIEIINELVSDAWNHGHECGMSEYSPCESCD